MEAAYMVGQSLEFQRHVKEVLNDPASLQELKESTKGVTLEQLERETEELILGGPPLTTQIEEETKVPHFQHPQHQQMQPLMDPF